LAVPAIVPSIAVSHDTSGADDEGTNQKPSVFILKDEDVSTIPATTPIGAVKVQPLNAEA
jgi:hypothetical protein